MRGVYEDLTGKRYGRLTVIERAENDKDYNVVWKCQCDCGQITYVRTNSLNCNKATSCGCYRDERLRQSNSKPFEYEICGMYCKGFLPSGDVFLFDTDDLNKVKKYRWNISKSGGGIRTVSTENISLGNLLFNSDRYNVLQFRNGNKLDYRHKNVYLITRKELAEKRRNKK